MIEFLEEKASLVKAMDRIARCIDDEDIFETWLSRGVGDGDVDDDTSLETMEGYCDDQTLIHLIKTFVLVMHRTYKSDYNGLYIDTPEDMKAAISILYSIANSNIKKAWERYSLASTTITNKSDIEDIQRFYNNDYKIDGRLFLALMDVVHNAQWCINFCDIRYTTHHIHDCDGYLNQNFYWAIVDMWHSNQTDLDVNEINMFKAVFNATFGWYTGDCVTRIESDLETGYGDYGISFYLGDASGDLDPYYTHECPYTNGYPATYDEPAYDGDIEYYEYDFEMFRDLITMPDNITYDIVDSSYDSLDGMLDNILE